MSKKKPTQTIRGDPFDHPEWKQYAERFRRKVLPQIKQSNVMMAISPKDKDGADIQFMLQIGAAVVLDKPIVLLVLNERDVPPRLARVADKIIEADLSTDKGQELARQKLLEYMTQ